MNLSNNVVPTAKRALTPGTRHVRRHIATSSAVTALGGLLFAYDTGVVSGALLLLKKDFGGLSAFQQELVTSLLLVGALAGALTAGRLADRIGRRRAVAVTTAVFGVLLAAFTPSYNGLLAARVIIGLGVGAASMVVPPVYRRDRAGAGPWRTRGPEPARPDKRNPGVLPRRLLARVNGELAAHVRPCGDTCGRAADRHDVPDGESALADPAGQRR